MEPGDEATTTVLVINIRTLLLRSLLNDVLHLVQVSATKINNRNTDKIN